jgi:hypothetical protein
MGEESRIPPGVSLLLIGSGLYWILSSKLISSFTVLTPGLFQTNVSGGLLITIVGIISTSMGLWIVQTDFETFRGLATRVDGWIFTVPLALAAIDIYLTLIILTTNSQIVELNPFVSSAIGIGAAAIVPFMVSYLALSQGLGLFMLRVGSSLFSNSKNRYLPFVLICGAACFGPVSNLVLLVDSNAGQSSYLVAGLGSTLISLVLFLKINRTEVRCRQG